MISKTLNYISHHAIAILALVCSLLALAGASYAATQLPKNSVGNAQIKQGAVAPPKFSKQIGGYVRLYAKLTPAGKIIYATPGAKVTQWAPSSYRHHWHDHLAPPGGFEQGLLRSGDRRQPSAGADLGDGGRVAHPAPMSESCRRTLIRW